MHRDRGVLNQRDGNKRLANVGVGLLEVQQVVRHLAVGWDRAGVKIEQVALAAPFFMQRMCAGKIRVEENPSLQRRWKARLSPRRERTRIARTRPWA